MSFQRWGILLLVIATAGLAGAGEVDDALAHAGELAHQHRYQAVLDILAPYSDEAALPVPTAYRLAAERGRACYHLARYREAYTELARAMRLRPDRIETGLYFEAAAYLTGRRAEALKTFEEILRSGARDLYLAVTLPGARAFLGDAAVWDLRDRYRQPLPVDLRHGVVMGLELGASRADVVATVGGDGAASGELVARAGPEPVWSFTFDHDDRLGAVTLYATAILLYTPYRLQFGRGVDWALDPAGAEAALGPAASRATPAPGVTDLHWQLPAASVTLEFAPPRPAAPPGWAADRPLLSVIRLARPPTPAPTSSPSTPSPAR